MIVKYCFISCIFYVTFFCTAVQSSNRNINCTEYTGKVQNKSKNFLTHIIGSGDEDDVHYFWSTYKLPSILIARTRTNTQVVIDEAKLEKLDSGAISFSEKPLAVTGVTISQIWEKVYAHSADEIRDEISTLNLDLDAFHWQKQSKNSMTCSNNFASLHLVSFNRNEEDFSSNGTFEIQFLVSGKEESSSYYPHLIYTGNSSEIRLLFNNMSPNASNSRYALEIKRFYSHSSECSDTRCTAVYTDSLSDEFSPGVFSDVDLKPPCPEKNSDVTFMRWRPVAYLSSEPNVANSSDAQLTEDCIQFPVSEINSIAGLYFKDVANSSSSVFNVTFGSVGDGFYKKTQFTSWSFMLGTGVPGSIKLSIVAIVLVSIGLGSLVLFLLTGGIFLSVQHCRRREDELPLTQNVGVNQ